MDSTKTPPARPRPKTPIWGSADRPVSICVATPVYDKPEHAYVRSYRRLVKPTDEGKGGLYGLVWEAETNGVIIEDARNALAAEALAGDSTHLLFIDADMVFPPDALQRLLVHDVPIVGALYFNRRPPFQPIVMRANHRDWHADESLLGHVYDYPKDQLVEVDATGCGFMLVQRAVLQAIAKDDPLHPPWFTRYPGLSEDFSFCVRAIEKGFPVFVDTSLKLGHVGKLVVDEAFAQRNRFAHPTPWRPGPR